LQLIGLICPILSIRWGCLHFSNIGPYFGELGIELKENLLVFGQLIFRENGIYRAFWFAQRAVNAFVWVYNQEIRAFIKTVYRANFHTVCVFALNAIFAYNKSHLGQPLLNPGYGW
jgi:hypothetical protein